MSDSFNHHNNLFGQNFHGTSSRSSLALPSSNLGTEYSEGATPYNSQGPVDFSLAPNSATNIRSQNQPLPVSAQLRFHRHAAESGFRTLNTSVPSGTRVHRTSGSIPMQTQNILNINIFMGNNSSVNINLLNNNLPSQIPRTNPFTFSSTNAVSQNNIVNSAQSNLGQNCMNLNSIQEHQTNSVLQMNESSQITRSYSQYASPTVPMNYIQEHQRNCALAINGTSHFTRFYTQSATLRVPTVTANPYGATVSNYNHQTAVVNPCLTQNIFNSSPSQPSHQCQSSHREDHAISQSSSRLNFSRKPFMHYPGEGCDKVLDSERRNDTLNDNKLHSQSDLPTTEGYPLIQHPLVQELPQDDNPKPRTGLHPQTGNQASTLRIRSHPYIKYGPYTCPRCHEVFQSSNSFAAHISKHYRDESPDDRKKRREGKIKSRGLKIAESDAGITVVPMSLQLGETSVAISSISSEKETKCDQEKGFPYLKIKEEPNSTD